MRQKAIVVLAAACLLSFLTPAPAHALWGGGWLERLSGPGPFWGHVFDARLLCIAAPGSTNQTPSTDPPPGTSLTREITDRAWLTGAGCHFLAPDDKRMEIGIDLGLLNSSENVLDYSLRPGLTGEEREVRLRTFMVTADFRVNRLLDVGAAIGRASFSSESETLFSDFSKTVSQPMRLTARPLAILWNSRYSEALVVRFDASKFHGTFTAEDFGATPGSFNEPGEITWAWSVRVDAFALLWRKMP